MEVEAEKKGRVVKRKTMRNRKQRREGEKKRRQRDRR